MNHPDRFVCVSQSVTERGHQGSDFTDGEALGAFLQTQMGERWSVDVLHRDSRGPLVFHEVEGADNVRMLQGNTSEGGAFERRQRGHLEADGLRHELQGHHAFESVVPGQPNKTHPAAAEDILKGETVKKLSIGAGRSRF